MHRLWSRLAVALLAAPVMVLCAVSCGGEPARSPTAVVGPSPSTPVWREAEPAGLDAVLNHVARQVVAKLDGTKKKAVAVVGFSDESGKGSRFGLWLAEELTSRLFQADGLKVIERSRLKAVLDENKIVLADAFNASAARQLGGLLGVDALAIGTYTVLGDQVRLNARLIGTEDGQVFGAANGALVRDDTIAALLEAPAASKARPPEDKETPDVARAAWETTEEDTQPSKTPKRGKRDKQGAGDEASYIQGLRFEYFNMPPWDGSPPTFDGRTPALVLIGTDLTQTPRSGTPAEGIQTEFYSVRVKGEVQVEKAGTYALRTAAAYTHLDVTLGTNSLGGDGREQWYYEPGWYPFEMIVHHPRHGSLWQFWWRRPGDSDFVEVAPTLMRTRR